MELQPLWMRSMMPIFFIIPHYMFAFYRIIGMTKGIRYLSPALALISASNKNIKNSVPTAIDKSIANTETAYVTVMIPYAIRIEHTPP